jgi:hypothetical protein
VRPDLLTFASGLAVGALACYLVGARNGEDVGRLVAETVETCDAIARDDIARCIDSCRAGLDLHTAALRALGDRCVLAVPDRDNLRVERMPEWLAP